MLPVLWAMVAFNFVIESIWISMVAERETWEAEGLDVPLAAILVFAFLDLAVRVTLGILVARDVKAAGAGRLRLALVPSTAAERASPAGWGWAVAIVTLPSMVLFSMARKHVWRLAEQAPAAPQAASPKERRKTMKGTPFAADVMKAMRKRENLQTLAFVLVWIVWGALSRI